MSLDRIQLTNFRSYHDQSFSLDPAINVVVGPNASGKTNLLEAIYVLSSTKSFRARDRQLVRYGQDYYRLVADKAGTEYALAYTYNDDSQTKQATHNGVKKSLTSHVGVIQAVLFEPGDLQMVGGPPEGRRRYLDYILCQTDRSYLLSLNHYRRVLRQRNSLLSNFNTGRIKDEIFAWDLKLTELANNIFQQRRQLLDYLQPLVDQAYAQIAASSVDLQLRYLASVNPDDYTSSFMNALAANLTTDLAAGFTTIGPHREDFRVDFKDAAINTVASRGEIRTTILALKMAELQYVQKTAGGRPLLLLDDVFSELDSRRRLALVQLLGDIQTVITTTDADAITGDIKGEYKMITMEKANAGRS